MCDLCHRPLRVDNRIGVCRQTPECRRERDRRRNLGPDRAAYNQAYRSTHDYRDYQKRYWLENKERLIEVRSGRLEEIRQGVANWRRAHPEKCREYSRVGNRKRASLLRGALFEPIDEFLLWDLDGRACYLCGEFVEFGQHHLDHVVPLSKRGQTVYENLAVVHPSCNLQKADKLVVDPLADLRPVIAQMARGDR